MKAQFIQRAVNGGVTRRAFDIRKKFGRGKACAVLIAFQLGHIDAIGRKAAHRLV